MVKLLREFRSEFRIAGLLAFALLATFLLSFGLKQTQIGGEMVGGIEFYISGPSAAFFILLFYFKWQNLWKLGIPTSESPDMNHPLESLTAEEIDQMIFDLGQHEQRIGRRKDKLAAAKQALEEDASQTEVMEALGMRTARRPGQR